MSLNQGRCLNYPAPERSEGAEVLKMAIREATFHPGEGRARKGGAAAP